MKSSISIPTRSPINNAKNAKGGTHANFTPCYPFTFEGSMLMSPTHPGAGRIEAISGPMSPGMSEDEG